MSEYGSGLKFSGQTKPDAISVDSYEHDLFAQRWTEIPSNLQMRAEYTTDGGETVPLYLGFAPRGLAAGTDGWLLQKFTYDGSGNVTLRQIAYGNWTGRAGLSYE